MLTLTVNDRPLDIAAIVERRRVLVPMRATFAALGANIRYDPDGRVIVARSATHSLRLRIDERRAIVDGRAVALDVPARVIAARTYVPLRFVAQSMGAVVGYDAIAQVVSVVANGAIAMVRRNTQVVALNPAPRSTVDTAYPTISASLGSITAPHGSVSLTLDGEDVTALATFDGTTITYMPRIGLRTGPHTATFSGRSAGGAAFSASWNFQTSLPPAADEPSFSNYGFRFYTNGPTLFFPGDWMHFYLIAPPGGSAQLQLCGLGYQYGLWSSRYGSLYEANFPAPRGLWLPSCAVTAVYTAWNGQQYFVPIPIVIGLYTGAQSATPTPTPRPTFTPRPLPTTPRRPEPTHAPSPAPHPRVPTPHPIPTSHPLPLRTPPYMPHPVPKHTG